MPNITLGGVEYPVRALPMRQAREFRQGFGELVNSLAGALRAVNSTNIDNFDTVAGLIDSLGDLLIGSIDQIAEYVFSYSPEIAADRERIENEATDTEMIAAFREVLALLYPFGGLMNSLTGRPGR